MEKQEKAQLIDRLKEAIQSSGLSNNRFAEERLGITKGMLSQVLNNWEAENVVGINTWNTIKKYLDATEGYKGVPTENFKKVCEACHQAHDHKAFIPVIGDGGYGKTYALKWFKSYLESQRGYKVFYVNAEGVTTRKQFLAAILHVLAQPTEGTIKQQIIKIKNAVDRLDCLLIIDEVSALKDHNVVIIKDIMTALKDICGVVFAGTPYFLNNLNKGANKSKHLYSETRDRLFSITYTLNAPTDEEAEQIFRSNGLTGEALTIVMGKAANKKMKSFAWFNKPTFRGISDCLKAIRIAISVPEITYPSIIC